MRNASAANTIRRLMTTAPVLPGAPGPAARSGHRYGHRQALALELRDDLCVVLDRLAEEITDRHDPDHLAAFDHRQMTNAVLMHQPQAVPEGMGRVDRDDGAHHDVGHRRRFEGLL